MARQSVCRCAAVVLVLCAWACSTISAQTPDRGRESASITHRRSAVEERIYAALEEQTEGDLSDVPLADVMDYFKARHDIPIRMDLRALQNEAVDTSEPVSRSFRGEKLRFALRALLHDLNLTYLVRDETLVITTKTEADETLEIRTYPVEDLLDGTRDDPDFDSFINLITSTVSPPTWDENGGPGAIQPYYRHRALVVSQTQQVHEEIEDLFDQLRRLAPAGGGARRGSLSGSVSGSWSRSSRPAEPDRRYVVDPQLRHIVRRLYSSQGGPSTKSSQ